MSTKGIKNISESTWSDFNSICAKEGKTQAEAIEEFVEAKTSGQKANAREDLKIEDVGFAKLCARIRREVQEQTLTPGKREHYFEQLKKYSHDRTLTDGERFEIKTINLVLKASVVGLTPEKIKEIQSIPKLHYLTWHTSKESVMEKIAFNFMCNAVSISVEELFSYRDYCREQHEREGYVNSPILRGVEGCHV